MFQHKVEGTRLNSREGNFRKFHQLYLWTRRSSRFFAAASTQTDNSPDALYFLTVSKSPIKSPLMYNCKMKNEISLLIWSIFDVFVTKHCVFPYLRKRGTSRKTNQFFFHRII